MFLASLQVGLANLAASGTRTSCLAPTATGRLKFTYAWFVHSVLAHQLLLVITSATVEGASAPRAEALFVLDCALTGAARAHKRCSNADVEPSMPRWVGDQSIPNAQFHLDTTRSAFGLCSDDNEDDIDGAGAAEFESGDTTSATAATGDSSNAQVSPVSIDALETEECVLMLLRELLDPAVWHAPSTQGSPLSIGNQLATILEHESLLQVGSLYS